MTEGVIDFVRRCPMGVGIEMIAQEVFGYVDGYSLNKCRQTLENSPDAYLDNGRWFVKVVG